MDVIKIPPYLLEDEQLEYTQVLDLRGKERVQVDRNVLENNEHFSKVYDKMVYTMLCMYSNWTTRQSYPSIKRLASLCLCSENTVRQSIRHLEKIGLIRTVPRKKKDGSQTSNLYILLPVPANWGQPTS
ncbi:MAG: helix-turn-helix domain-containing protein [Bacillota bacterium]